jgi:hypothetical protein
MSRVAEDTWVPPEIAEKLREPARMLWDYVQDLFLLAMPEKSPVAETTIRFHQCLRLAWALRNAGLLDVDEEQFLPLFGF